MQLEFFRVVLDLSLRHLSHPEDQLKKNSFPYGKLISFGFNLSLTDDFPCLNKDLHTYIQALYWQTHFQKVFVLQFWFFLISDF